MKEIVKLLAAMQLLNEQLDELQGNPIYFQKVKQLTNNLQKEIDRKLDATGSCFNLNEGNQFNELVESLRIPLNKIQVSNEF